MKTGNNPNEFDISLIQQRDQRQVMVEKMRGKLAGHSKSFIQAKERQAYATRKRAFVLGWRVATVRTEDRVSLPVVVEPSPAYPYAAKA